jgi:L-arabinose isomerase
MILLMKCPLSGKNRTGFEEIPGQNGYKAFTTKFEDLTGLRQLPVWLASI